MLLVETARQIGLDTAISAALAPWRKHRAVHDPGKILLDVAPAVALGGDCLADVAMLRAEPTAFGPVASDPAVSRLIDTLAGAGPRALAAIRGARAEVRQEVWRLAGHNAPDRAGEMVVDIDGVLVLAHSDKQDATATWKKTFGATTRCSRSWTTAARAPGNRSPACCGRAVRAATPPPTTSKLPAWPWLSCRRPTGAGAGR